MGIKCAQDEFQGAMEENFGDIKNVLSICDDMIVYGFEEDCSDHDKALRQLYDTRKGEKLQIQPGEICGKDIIDIFLRSHHF